MADPAEDELEVNVFGPGFGECIVAHLGSDNWVIVDSCEDEDHRPAALAYLARIGVDPATAVKLIIVTHWHDDHIRGMGEVVRACHSSQVCVSAALTQLEFLQAMYVRDTPSPGRLRSGMREMAAVFEAATTLSKPVLRALSNRIVLQLEAGHTAHGLPCEVRTLSPSDQQYQLSQTAIAAMMPNLGTTRARAVAQSPNHLSVAAWLAIGEIAVLLGADLEDRTDTNLGWHAVSRLPALPGEKAQIFKVPHHGSVTGHNDAIWTDRVREQAIAIVAPWARSSGLPSDDDVRRICNLTSFAFATSTGLRLGNPKRREQAVEKQLREMGIRVRSARHRMGHVRLRKRPLDAEWNVVLLNGACRLDELAA